MTTVATTDSFSPRSIPWYLWAVVFASTSVVLGVIWDISWHRTIGRDSFWTPAHMAIYVGGVVAGLSCGWLALKTTFTGEHGYQRRALALHRHVAPTKVSDHRKP